MSAYRLDAKYNGAKIGKDACFTFTFHNLSQHNLEGFKIGFASMTRIADDARINGADLVRKEASYHEFSAPKGLLVRPGSSWEFSFTGSEHHLPAHRLDGPKSAVLLTQEGVHDVHVSDLFCESLKETGPLRDYPKGKISQPMFMQPWPSKVSIDHFVKAPRVFAPTALGPEREAMSSIADLHARLYPQAREVFRLDDGDLSLEFAATDLESEAYKLVFLSSSVRLEYGDDAGRLYGLITLAQLIHGAASAPDDFGFPLSGTIEDQPRFKVRGGHLDVSRHFYTKNEVTRLIDIMAWAKLNSFQWHLTDDEGWRIQINAYPELTEVGSERGPESAMTGQYSQISKTYGGYYTQDEARDVVAHAGALNITIVPEVDIPGHCAMVLHALPYLVDPDEPANSYKSVQGFTNNALNPSMPKTYEFVENVIAEIADIFPGPYIHVGADEVAEGCWMTSPKAKILMQAESLQNTAEIQAYFLRRVQKILRSNGKNLAGWDEVSHGGGVDQEGTLLVAWQSPDLIPALTAQGYRVIASPGQAYYMDMVQAEGWDEPGAQWAGVVPPRHSYEFDPEEGLPEGERGTLAGVQACIWTEHICTQALFNHLVFPRFYAVAEAAWTPKQQKDWQRFCHLSRHMPQL